MSISKKNRAYPKCFQTNQSSIFIYNILNENNLEETIEAKYLFSNYTLLLCASKGLSQEYVSKEQILLRLCRSLNIDGNISLEMLFKIIKMLMNKDLSFFQLKLDHQQYANFLKHHQEIQRKVISDLKKRLDN